MNSDMAAKLAIDDIERHAESCVTDEEKIQFYRDIGTFCVNAEQDWQSATQQE